MYLCDEFRRNIEEDELCNDIFLFNISNRIIQKKSTLRNYILYINSFNPKKKNNEENYFHGVFRIS